MTSSEPATALDDATRRVDHSALASWMSSGASYIAELIGRIVSGIKGIAPVVLGFSISCQSAVEPSSVPAPPEVQAAPAVPVPAAVVEDTEPKKLGRFTITFYYVIGEEEVSPKPVIKEPANDNQSEEGSGGGGGDGDGELGLGMIAPPDKVTLFSGTCEPIAEVSREFAGQLAIQGTGKLRDGRMLNVWGRCNCGHSPCFKVTSTQWGTAGSGHPLQPFRTVAVDPKIIKLGSLLYVPLLEGRVMPGRAPWGGFVHDGCVVAHDVGGGIKDYQIDLFVGRKGWFLGMSGSRGSHSWARHVPVFDGSKMCERKGRKIGRKTGAI